MAERPIFVPRFEGNILVETHMVTFQWFPGLSKSQKQKCIKELHNAAASVTGGKPILEVSTKSELEIGRQLSAFSLSIPAGDGSPRFLEAMYQASKKFEHGGPFDDIERMGPVDAKRDERLKNSGRLVGFYRKGDEWPLQPPTAFYDWLYLKMLSLRRDLTEAMSEFYAFTDIEFNPRKSFSCQAYSAALYLALQKRDLIKNALDNKDAFLRCVINRGGDTQRASIQPSLF